MRGIRKIAAGLMALVLGLGVSPAGALGAAPAAGEGAGIAATAPAPDRTIPPELADFERFVTQVMSDWNVPGMSVGIVRGGEVIYARGFGERDRAENLPVTPETLFGIGSVTKSFTAAAFQSLVDEGILDWDTPVRAYLPDFRLQDPLVTEQVTPRDWALHRTGIAQADIPWLFNPELDPEQFMENLHTLPFKDPFRSTFAYNNLGYIVLGEIIEEVTGKPWHQVVEERVLQPLGMTDTNFEIADMVRTPDFSRPYAEKDGETIEIPYTVVGAAGPAGAINASLNDMLKYVQMHLNLGRAGDRQVISLQGITEMHRAQVTLPSEYGTFYGYGLGWFVESYRDHFRVQHGGRTPGFSAAVSLLPRDGFGVVALANADGTPAVEIVARGAIDRLLGLEPIDWNGILLQAVNAHTPDEEATPNADSARTDIAPLHPLTDYVGTYTHPLYGDVRIEEKNGKLQAVYYTTTIPLTHQHYDHFRGPLSESIPLEVPIQFLTNDEGQVYRVLVDFELSGSPIPFDRLPSARLQDPAFLSGLAGRYALQGEVVTVTLRGTELQVKIGEQPPYTLVPEGEDGFRVREVASVTVRFILNDEGTKAIKMIMTQSGYPFELERVD